MKILTSRRNGTRFLSILACLGLAVCAGTSVSQAQIETLSQNNSVVKIDVGSQTGLFNWSVDGMNQALQQWFWFRAGPSGPEAPINTLGTPSIVQSSPFLLSATYTNTLWSVRVDFTLGGGASGSGASDLNEQITINNIGSAGTTDFHFFQFSHFSIGTPGTDSVTLQRAGSGGFKEALQSSGSLILSENMDTVIGPFANHGEAANYAQTLGKLTNGVPDVLNDVTNAGPGDVTWAFEWDLTVNQGGSQVIGKDVNLLVPEPSVVALIGAGFGAALVWRRRRQA